METKTVIGTTQSRLDRLYSDYKTIDLQYMRSVTTNIHGNKIVGEDLRLKEDSKVAFVRFLDYAKGIGMDSRQITNYIISRVKKR